MSAFDPFDYHDKLYTFMKALEIKDLDNFIDKARTKDYEALGKEMTRRIKILSNRVDELEGGLKEFKKLLDS